MSMVLFVLILCIIYSRSQSKNALELLSDAEKGKVAEHFSKFGKLHLFPIIIVFCFYFIVKYYLPSFSNVYFIGLILFFLVFLIMTSVVIIKKLKQINVPSEYIQEYKQSRLVYNFGFLVCGIILLYELLK
jgi:phosphatidylglycerophosphate synthase